MNEPNSDPNSTEGMDLKQRLADEEKRVDSLGQQLKEVSAERDALSEELRLTRDEALSLYRENRMLSKANADANARGSP